MGLLRKEDFHESLLDSLNGTTSIISITNKIVSATSDKKINLKFIGDSITAGVGGTGYLLNGDIIYGDHKVNTSGHCFANNIKTYLTLNYLFLINTY